MPVLQYAEWRRLDSNVVVSESGQPELPEEWDFEPIVEDDFENEEEIAKKKAKLINVSPSQFVEFAIRVPNKDPGELQRHVPFSFDGRRYLRLPYDTSAKRSLYKCGRQVEKSTLLGNKCLSYCCIVNAFNVLYVSPTNQQTKVFSADRLKEPIETSDTLKAWTTTKLSDNVFLKKFINRSQITLRYAYHNADRTRGIPADLILIDEIQDVITDNIPVIEECASHSHYKLFIYSGTPKSFDNAIEHYWINFSTQNEWVVPCERHGTPNNPSSWHWNVLGEDNIGKEGLVCDRCKLPINSMHPLAQWASMNPGVKQKLKDYYEGYRIPQLMVPWMAWGEILDKRAKFSRSTFYNEVLGLSYDSGTRPLTRKDVVDNCTPGQYLDKESLTLIKANLGIVSPVYAGIDWGCYSEDTRTLTNRGFLTIDEILDDDLIAQFDPVTKEISYAKPLRKIVFPYEGEMVHFKTNNQDILVTPDHKMLWETRAGTTMVTQAKDLIGKDRALFNQVGAWIRTDRDEFYLPEVTLEDHGVIVPGRPLPMDLWAEFLGWAISEGGVCLRDGKPYDFSISQRNVSPEKVQTIRRIVQSLPFNYRESFYAPTGDYNWKIHGKQLWDWMAKNVGTSPSTKHIPREFLNTLSRRQLKILFDALMAGDGHWDTRFEDNGSYYTTSRGLADDVQELCLKLGYCSKVTLHKPAEGNRKDRWRVSISPGRMRWLNEKAVTVEQYKGRCYCFHVPTGFFITERNGCVAIQGNTGEGSFTVIALGAYLREHFNIFYIHRFEGQEIEPPIQLELIEKLIRYWDAKLVGCDYGGGFDRNDALARTFGKSRIVKYQYSQPGQKVKWEEGLQRFLVHRTEVMSDIFNAIKRRDVMRFPDFTQFEDPFAKDMLNIFSEYNEVQRQVQYKHAPDTTDDSFHAILLCFLASMIRHPRYDVMNPTQKTGYAAPEDT